MSHLNTALRAVSAAAVTGGLVFAASATAVAEPNTGTAADMNTLAANLSKGYGLNNCKSQELTESGELAELLCGQSPDPSGPGSGVYALFSNGTNLASAFSSTIKDVSLAACGDAGQSPGTWKQNGQTGGQIACGTYKNYATLTWTTDAKNVLGHLTSSNSDVNALYQWWRTNG
ncbi:serine/threonine protein kinase [Mycobacterium sp. E2238]|uniref:serine/threonine protein kinase n=1 Tax=Mycobacterium sp. E2238 TaxID=1834131 RepID=UPI0008021B90|nr:serine/threonine protein kinase [Mycobacterium sp. E2238]OBI37618.1 serine/threonine protein kinase [Mycobacterium sp. E2238]